MANSAERAARTGTLSTSLALAAIGLGSCVSSAGEGSVGHHEESIVAGVSNPEELGWSVPEAQQNAVVNALLNRGATSLTCTGTLIGDRVALTAGHCVMQNMAEWWLDGDPVIVGEPGDFAIRVGPDAEDPACRLDVAEVHLHPEILRRFDDAAIDHDLALLVLQAPIRESCPEVLSIPLVGPAQEPPPLDEPLLLGGYGTTDPEGDSAWSPERFWAVAPLSESDDATLVLEDAGTGFPAPGDSGAPVLRAATDGSLRVVGVMSTSYYGIGTATRPDSEPAFLDDVLDRELLCGCDLDALCAGDCACDPDCRCACDSTAGCEDECACDPDCAAPTCACDETAACDPDCACDPSCAPTDCGCDVDGTCDAACACDVDCAPAPTCACDASPGCDEDCGCDLDCRHRATGCAFASAPPASRPVWRWLGLLAFVLAAGRARSRSAGAPGTSTVGPPPRT